MILLDSFKQSETLHFQRIVQIEDRSEKKYENTELEVESIRKMNIVYIVSYRYGKPPRI